MQKKNTLGNHILLPAVILASKLKLNFYFLVLSRTLRTLFAF